MNRYALSCGLAMFALLAGTAETTLLATESRPIAGHGAGNFTDASGGFFAEATATHLGACTHYGMLVFTPTDNPVVFAISGRGTYEAANGDLLDANVTATLNLLTGVLDGTATFDGGTGRFTDASGTAYVVAQLRPDGSFTFTFVGVISY